MSKKLDHKTWSSFLGMEYRVSDSKGELIIFTFFMAL